MRIALVTGHYMPEIGYQEVYLARSFARLGHEVRVITSNKSSPSSQNIETEHYQAGLSVDKKMGFSICRLKPIFKYHAIIIPWGLKEAVQQFHPDLVVAIGVGKLFPAGILTNANKRSYKLVTLFGDNSDFWGRSSRMGNLKAVWSRFVQKYGKNRLYVKAINSCDKILLYTPETEEIISSYIPGNVKETLSQKKIISTLGFDPEEFYFDITERENIRRELNISPEEVVFITSTRVYPSKNLERIIDIISEPDLVEKSVRYIIIGFLGDSYEKSLRDYIIRKGRPEIFHCYPFLSHDKVRKLYNAADIGIWLNASISIQEAMGTGLPIILENKPSVNHLVQEGKNGWFYDKGKISEAISKALSEVRNTDAETRINKRSVIYEENCKTFSYNTIAQSIIKCAFHRN